MLASGQVGTLGNAIQSHSHLFVAEYQRNYAWKTDNVNELVDDLMIAEESGEDHFLGTLILQTEEDGATAVVDGQQRLTTVFVMLACLRDMCAALPSQVLPPHSPGARPRYVMADIENVLYSSHASTESRFAANPLIRETFATRVIAHPDGREPMPRRGSAQTKALRDGYFRIHELFSRQLVDFDTPDEKLSRIASLFDTIVDRMNILTITTTQLNESLQVFNTLNNRGLPLGPSDIVRGSILETLSKGLDSETMHELHRRIFDDWKEMVDALGAQGIDKFLRHFLVSTGPEKVQKTKIPLIVQERIRSSLPFEAQKLADDFWSDLRAEANIYGELVNPQDEGATGYYLSVLATLADSYRIVALPIMNSEIVADESARDDMVRLLYVASIRWFMAGRSAQGLETAFQHMALKLRHDHAVAQVTEELAAMADLQFDVLEYMRHRATGVAMIKALLGGIERELRSATSVPPASIHVEMIAPDINSAAWTTEVLDGGVYSDDYDELIDILGNRTLVPKMTSMKDRRAPFVEKVVRFNSSGVQMTHDLFLLPNHRWTQEMIMRRTEWMAEVFPAIWSSRPATGQIPHFSEWLAGR